MHWASEGDSKHGLLSLPGWAGILQQRHGKGKIILLILSKSYKSDHFLRVVSNSLLQPAKLPIEDFPVRRNIPGPGLTCQNNLECTLFDDCEEVLLTIIENHHFCSGWRRLQNWRQPGRRRHIFAPGWWGGLSKGTGELCHEGLNIFKAVLLSSWM